MKKTDKKWVKATALVLTVTLVGGGTGIWTCARMRAETAQKETAQAEAQVQENSTARVTKEKEVELSEADKEKLSKEETVYVIANADGSTQKLIVSDWLKNALKEQKISDTTELTEISNVKGEESFAKENGNTGVWDAQGNDIYYQGNIEKELPVELKISYTLDGQKISPEELAGKSGKVTIRFDYTNRQKETVLVDGKEEELYVPFVLLTGMFVDNEKFANIEVSNGKTINDGERTVIMGYAMPGLKDNLEIESEDLNLDDIDLPDYVEVTADVTDFELAATLTIATNEIFGDLDVELDDKMDDLSSDMTDLQDAMQELMDGTSDLYDGVLELVDGTDELTDGINELNDGARDLKNGAGSLYDGTGTLKSGIGELVKGATLLSSGLSELTAQNGNLQAGADQVFQVLLSTVQSQMTANGISVSADLTKENYQTVLDGKIRELLGKGTAALQSINPGLPALTTQNYAQVIDRAIAALSGSGVTPLSEPDEGGGMSASPSREASQAEREAGSSEASTPEDGSSTSEGQTTEQETTAGNETTADPEPAEPEETEPAEQSETVEEETLEQARVQAKAVPMLTAREMTPEESSATVAKLTALKAGISQLIAAETQLNSYHQFYTGLLTYTGAVETKILPGAQNILEGARKLNAGASDLQKGAGDLYDGTKKLKDGTGELKDGGQELKDGVQELKDGALELKDGTVEFNDEGIQKLVDLLDGDLPELVDRFDGTKSAAQAYQSFAGISDDMDGQVRFIYKTAAIEQ